MTERNKLTPSELDKVLALYQSLLTLVIFFAGFVFVTIPLVIFSAEVSHLYGRLVLYFLLTSLVIYATIIDLYHANTLEAFGQTIPNAFPVLGKYRKAGVADLLMVPAQFFAFASISFMLLLKGPEFTVDAVLWFLVTIGRLVLSSYIVFGVFKKIKQQLLKQTPILLEVSTIIFLVVVCFAIIGNLIYGLLLLETITSGTNIGISILFTNLVILWLFPIAGLFVLLIVEKFRTRNKQN